MPTIRSQTTDALLECTLAEWAEFESAAAWRQSRKGNWWREWEGRTVTLFRRNDVTWRWCIADDEEARYSHGGYENKEDAMTALGEALGIGY